MRTIGFIGLGAMGSRIANRLLDAGHRDLASLHEVLAKTEVTP